MKQTIPVVGMMCAVCAAHVEKKLSGLQGVDSCAVSLASRTALVDYNPEVVSLDNMKEALQGIGYDLVTEPDRDLEAIERQSYLNLRRRVIVSWILAILCMAISMHYISFGNILTNNILMMIISIINLIYCGRQFYSIAWRQLQHGSANMDTLVALSTAVSFTFSVFNTFWGESFWGSRGMDWHTYYDASVMIITFVLTGRLLEERAKNGTASSIRALMGLQPKTARVLQMGKLSEVPLATIQPEDVLEVRPGEKVPVDGVVTEGTTFIDESMISGEAVPVEKQVGDKVLAGTIVRQGTFRFEAQQVGESTVLAGIIKMVQQAQGSKAPVQRTVDKIALIFVPTVMAIALLTCILWLALGGMDKLPQAILSAVSVLVIACPCAMGLATPTALMVGIGKAAEQHILIKDATALEGLCAVNAMVFDKTGTLTELAPDSQSYNGEKLKDSAIEAVQQLKHHGIELFMMSGDKEEAAHYWAEKAGIAHYQSKVLPQDKEDLVRKLQGEGKHVAMVGDGINDSQALAAADVSIAMGQGTDVAMEVAQVTLIGNDLRRIPDAIKLSKRTVNMIHQNLFWAFIYNLVCIPLAAGLPYLFGYSWQITPMLASALMAFSSVSVVLNSLRLKIQK
ncbi:MAG: copper-translocating P-type ATPase [Bacteroidaceae bacterium]|jgi:Cu2+-exporting ATPase|nr:copper-translocating P-type ATPase [Bacteroidaceae bacterium]